MGQWTNQSVACAEGVDGSITHQIEYRSVELSGFEEKSAGAAY